MRERVKLNVGLLLIALGHVVIAFDCDNKPCMYIAIICALICLFLIFIKDKDFT